MSVEPIFDATNNVEIQIWPDDYDRYGGWCYSVIDSYGKSVATGGFYHVSYDEAVAKLSAWASLQDKTLTFTKGKIVEIFVPDESDG